MSFKISRRNLLKFPVALGGLAMVGALGGCKDDSSSSPAASSYNPSTTNSLISSLPPYYPGTETLGANEMRITFLGTSPKKDLSDCRGHICFAIINFEPQQVNKTCTSFHYIPDG